MSPLEEAHSSCDGGPGVGAGEGRPHLMGQLQLWGGPVGAAEPRTLNAIELCTEMAEMVNFVCI